MRGFLHLLILTCALAFIAAHAEKMDLPTHDLVIQKLESVIGSVTDKPATLRGIEMRLGDLYSERARIRAMQEEDHTCPNCDGAKSDRAKAIKYYQDAFNGATPDQQERILLQQAHLYQMNGDMKKSEGVYQGVISKGEKGAGPSLYGEALAGRGEMNYRKGEFAKAKVDFEKALKYPILKKSFVKYRLAWCLLNEGQAARAKAMIISVLRSDDPTVEPSFRKDLSRDLATFIARGKITNAAIDEMLRFSPADAQKSNLFYLGTECDRLSNADGSLLVWRRYSDLPDVTPLEALEIKIRVTQTRLDQGFKKEALTLMSDATKTWRKQGCKDKDTCEELRLRLRNMVLTWNKKEKINPSMEVLEAYGIYVKLFERDYEMIYWAAQLARAKSQMPQALVYYRLAADVATEEFNRAKNAEDRTAIKKIQEGSLLSEIELAEAMNNLDAKEQAYNRYLRLNSKGQKAFEVRYQLAHVYYEKGQNKKAAENFYELAEDKNGEPADLRVKSADLALDSLALQKENETLEKWALHFAEAFPAKKTEYLGIARKASVNQAASMGSQSDASDRRLRAALLKLKSAPLQGATREEKILILKNQIAIAEKLRDIETVDSATGQLLKIPKLSKEDHEFALSRRVWVAELKLNFREALRIAKQMEMKELSPDKKALRLALLTELAGQNPSGYYQQALQATKDREKRHLILAKLVKLSRNPWGTLNQYLSELRHSPHILAPLTLEVFARSQDYGKLESILKISGVRSTPAGVTLSRYTFLREFNSFESHIQSHRLSSSSDRALTRTINERLKLLADADKWANNAIRSSDWTLQIITLSRVSKENQRLYDNIMKLPVPRGLRGPQREQYQNLLMSKAQPFEDKAKTVNSKLSDLWGQSGVLDQMSDIISKSSKYIRGLIAQEVTRLLRVAPGSREHQLKSVLAEAHNRHDVELSRARNEVRQNPFNERDITRLKNLEDTDGSPAMSTFLDARLASLHEGGLR